MRFFLTFLLITCLSRVFADMKEPIRITGSASVYPIIAYIYENTNSETKKQFKKNPVIESVGTGAGFDSFCKQPFSKNSLDIINASRKITEKELENCKKIGINNLHKITVGIDGIVIAYPKKDKTFNNHEITISDLQKALSKYTVINEEVVMNKITHWNEIREDLPKTKIIIYGPNSNSGTYDFFREIIQKQCSNIPQIAKYIETLGKKVKDECGILRKEVYIQMPDQDSTIGRKVELQQSSIAVLRFTYFKNSSKFNAIPIDGVMPTEDSIAIGKYKISRPLFIYFDSSYITKVAGMKEFLTQIAKFSYRDLFKNENEYKTQESSSIIIQKEGNVSECIENKKVIGFEFNCNKNG